MDHYHYLEFCKALIAKHKWVCAISLTHMPQETAEAHYPLLKTLAWSHHRAHVTLFQRVFQKDSQLYV